MYDVPSCHYSLQYFTVLAILEGFKWKIDRTYEDFAELQRTVSLYELLFSRNMVEELAQILDNVKVNLVIE